MDQISQESKKKNILEPLFVAVLIPLMLFIVVPIEIYSNNIDELKFSLGDFIFMSLIIFVVVSLINFLILFFVPKKIYKVLKGLNLALATLLFVQGSYLNIGLNSLMGDNLASSDASATFISIDILIWIFTISLFVILGIVKTKKTTLSTMSLILCVALFFSQIISPISIFASNPSIVTSAANKNSEGQTYFLSQKGLASLASTNNVYYFCIDRFDELFAEKAIVEDPHIFDDFEGFTWFQDYISLYAHTFPAVSTMLTDKEYDGSKSRIDFLNEVYTGETALSKMSENGYTVKLYTDSYYSFNKASNLPDYIENKLVVKDFRITDYFKLSLCMTGLSLYRCLPFGIKNFLSAIDTAKLNSYAECFSEDNYIEYETSNEKNGNYISHALFEVTEEKQFSFIHFEGCHEISNKKYNTKSIKYCINLIKYYLNALRESDLYDNSTIIITGDHPDAVDDQSEVKQPRRTALFIKPSNSSSEPLKTSQAQVSQTNIWPTIFKSENIEYTGTKSAFEIDENEDQIRYHHFHTYNFPLIDYVYKITGNGKLFENWEKVDENYFAKSLMD